MMRVFLSVKEYAVLRRAAFIALAEDPASRLNDTLEAVIERLDTCADKQHPLEIVQFARRFYR